MKLPMYKSYHLSFQNEFDTLVYLVGFIIEITLSSFSLEISILWKVTLHYRVHKSHTYPIYINTSYLF